MAIFSGNTSSGSGTDNLMRRRTDQFPVSIIARDLAVTGDLETEGMVKIEGRIRGRIRAAAQILVSPGATIEGDLHTKEAVIGGEVVGAIHASERVELQASAVVTGDIFTQRIVILEGGRVSGEVSMDPARSAPGSTTSHNS